MKKIIILFLVTCITLSISSFANHRIIESIDIIETVNIANTQQIIRIKGNNKKNPILLYLNGGPGDSVLDQMDNMFGELQKNFTVVLWDQRNSGQTARLKNPQVLLTQALFQEDTYQLIQYLLKKFDQQKIVLVGHSYGTALGFEMAKNHPELLHVYIATNPLVNQIESERLTLAMLQQQAKENKNTKAIKELAEVAIPFENAEDLYYARKWLFDFEGKNFAKKKLFKKTIFAWSSTWLSLFNEACQENLFESTKKLDCPVFFIIGLKDYQTNYTLTQQYYDLLEAPQKEIHVIENAGHLIPYENRIEFQKLIKEYILPMISNNKD